MFHLFHFQQDLCLNHYEIHFSDKILAQMFQKSAHFQNEITKSYFHCTVVQTGARQSGLNVHFPNETFKYQKTKKNPVTE